MDKTEQNPETPFFSIIIPIYNVEKYLDHCIQGALKQTFKNYEVILVDDGSPDRSGIMCDQYASNDSQIKVIHKPNGGLSSARNAGIDIAQGKYIIFLDSDDFWDDMDALNNIYNNLCDTHADILVFPAKRYYESNGNTTLILPGAVERDKIIFKEKKEAIKYLIENNIYRAAAWNKVIARKIIVQHSMKFKEGYLSEDMDWCGDLLLFAESFDFYGNPFYCYRQQRIGSITSGKKEKLIADKLFMCEKGFNQISGIQDKDLAYSLGSYYAYEYSVLLGVSEGVTNKKLIAKMKDLRPLLKYDTCKKVKQVNLFMNILGFSITRRILCMFVKVKR